MSNITPFTKLLSDIPKQKIALNNTQGFTITYEELLREVEKTSRLLSNLNIRGFATLMDNTPAHVIALVAAMDATSWILPLPPFFTKQQCDNALNQSGCAALLSDVKIPNLPIIQELTIGGSLHYIYNTGIENTNNVIDGTSLVTFTSGSTEDPKGLCLSWENILKTSQSVALALDSLSIRKHMSVLPLSILLEQTAGVFAALLSGAECNVPSLKSTGVLEKSSSGSNTLLKLLESTGTNSCILVPELLKTLIETQRTDFRRLSKLRFLAVGGSKISPDTLKKAQDFGLPVYEGYGLSEAGSVVSLNTPGQHQIGSVGRSLIPDSLSISKEGEVFLNTPSFLGYCGSNERPTSPFATGDLGEIDSKGFLRIYGRKKNVLITSMGRNVCPEWIESSLMSSNDIDQACIHGDGQKSLSALIVSKQSNDVIQQSINRINLTLPEYARIGNWHRVSEFTAQEGTLTGNGKLRRKAISMLHLQNTHSAQPS